MMFPRHKMCLIFYQPRLPVGRDIFGQVLQGLDWKEGPFKNEEMQTGTFNQGSGDKTERIEASSFLFQTVVYFLLPQPPRK